MNIGNSDQAVERKVCQVCGREFISAFRHPHQKYCSHPECVRERNAARQLKCARQHRKDKAYHHKVSRRKHEEYLRRKERNAQGPPPKQQSEAWYDPVTLKNIDSYFMGLISIATGTSDTDILGSLRNRCYEIGRSIRTTDGVSTVSYFANKSAAETKNHKTT
ncbi:MAG: hypothetical protein JXR78_16705 [Victivallales bacterium]|nr:hypothetical protein [Victivallales bacterium]